MNLIDYLIPRTETDSRFRQEIERLSTVGLRIIAGACIGLPSFGLLLGIFWFPAWPDPSVIINDIAMVVTGAIVIGLSFSVIIRPYARALGIGVGFLAAVLQAVGMVHSADFHREVLGTDPEQHIPISVAFILIIAMGALPLKPLQTLSLGSAIVALYVAWIVWNGSSIWGWGGFPIFISIVMVVLCTALTAVVYCQRAAAFLARQAAEESFEELRRAQARLLIDRNAASQSRFAAAMSHEINSPLGALASAFETLRAVLEKTRLEGQLPRSVEDATQSGRSSYERLTALTQRMKYLTNLDRAEEQLANLNDLCQATVGFLQAELEAKADVELDLESTALVRCRPQQISAVLSNLLRNAAASLDGRGLIQVRSREGQDEVVLEVQDSGRGIEPERLSTLFEPAFRVEGSRVATTNWGLFVSQSIVSEHGGRMEIESVIGEGSTVRVVLPVSGSGSPLASAGKRIVSGSPTPV